MCEFCIEHGEGKKWYLKAKNCSDELFNEETKRFMAEFFGKFEEMVVGDIGALDKLLAANRAAAKAMFPSFKRSAHRCVNAAGALGLLGGGVHEPPVGQSRAR